MAKTKIIDDENKKLYLVDIGMSLLQIQIEDKDNDMFLNLDVNEVKDLIKNLKNWVKERSV